MIKAWMIHSIHTVIGWTDEGMDASEMPLVSYGVYTDYKKAVEAIHICAERHYDFAVDEYNKHYNKHKARLREFVAPKIEVDCLNGKLEKIVVTDDYTFCGELEFRLIETVVDPEPGDIVKPDDYC